MPGPAALIALAARLGIPKGAKIIAEKGFKYLQRLVTKAEKQVTKQQKTSGKKFTGEGLKRKQESATQRKKVPQHGSVKQQENTIRRQRIKAAHQKKQLKEKYNKGNGLITKKETVQIAKEHAAWSKLSIKDKWNLRSKIPPEKRVSNFKKRK